MAVDPFFREIREYVGDDPPIENHHVYQGEEAKTVPRDGNPTAQTCVMGTVLASRRHGGAAHVASLGSGAAGRPGGGFFGGVTGDGDEGRSGEAQG